MTNSENSYSRAFKEIAKVANSNLSLKRVLNVIAKSSAKALKADAASLLILDPQKKHLIPAGSYGLSDSYLRKGALRANESLSGILEGKVITIPDVSKNKHVQYPEAAAEEKIASILGAPVIQKEDVVGEIRIYTHQPRQFSQADKDFLLSIANMSAVILEKVELYQALKIGQRETVIKQTKLSDIPKLPSLSLRPASFAHPSEEEFAKLLDFYRIEWLYEPRSFPLEKEGDRITEMFTPDFYLPELDLYVELTTLKQSLITEKNRKLRRFKELYPEINIKLLNKGDYLRLLAKYGYGPLGEAKVQGINQVLLSHTQIQRRVRTLAKRISYDYSGKNLVLIGILKGVVCFMADLMQHISLPTAVDFMAISYYGGDSGQAVKITKDLDSSITGLDVLMVEDIVDTGMTLNYILNHLSAQNPASLRVCALLDKRARRLADVPLYYVGFEIADEFVVGYGLDFRGEYRNLPFVGVLNPELIKEGREK